LEKVRYYLSHPEEPERVREAGHRRALNEHTCHRRFQQLFRQLGLP
jgi:spore maturation protein CgeB